ncbi:hypothetical protein Bpfe_020366, partial [Biomphalaria pfeifferi]
GDNAYRIVKNFSKVIKKGGKFSVYLMYNETSENKVVCFVNTDTESVEIEVLHFEWRPSDCVNPNYNITVYRQAFYCSWTERKKLVTVPSPQNIPITFLKQTGFVWIEVHTEVADSRYTTLNVTCNLVPSKTLSPEISVAKRNLQTVASTASPTASISISTRNNGTTTTKQSRPKTTKTPIITNTPPMVTLTTTDMRTAPETTSNTSSLSSAPDKREATKSKVPSKTLSPEISVAKRNLQTVASTASPTASISISTRNNGTTTTKQSRPKTTKTPIITNTPPMVTLTTTDMRTAPETTSNTSSLSSAPDKREATKSKDTHTLVHIAIGVGVTAFLVLILVIALCVIYLRQRKKKELSINSKRTSIDGVLIRKEDYETSLYTQVDINHGSTPKETDQLPISAVAASLPSTCNSNTETQSPDVEYAAVNKSKKGSNPMVDPSNKNMNQFPNADYATVNKVNTIINAMPEKSNLNETQFPNAEYASVNKVNKSSNLLLEPSNANESNFSKKETAVENKETKSPHPKPAQNKSSTLPNYTNVKAQNTETPESLYSHLSHMKSADARESENIYNG